MQKKKLTGWLILLILWIGLFSFGGGTGSLRTIKDDYQPYMADYPSLPAAITIFQLFLGAGMAVWMYAAWVLYRREPGTLAQAQICLVTGAALRIASGYAIPLFAGFPGRTVQELMQDALLLTVFLFLFTTVWYLYLARSQKVREIYTGG